MNRRAQALYGEAVAELLRLTAERTPSPNDKLVRNLASMACGDAAEVPSCAAAAAADAAAAAALAVASGACAPGWRGPSLRVVRTARSSQGPVPEPRGSLMPQGSVSMSFVWRLLVCCAEEGSLDPQQHLLQLERLQSHAAASTSQPAGAASSSAAATAAAGESSASAADAGGATAAERDAAAAAATAAVAAAAGAPAAVSAEAAAARVARLGAEAALSACCQVRT